MNYKTKANMTTGLSYDFKIKQDVNMTVSMTDFFEHVDANVFSKSEYLKPDSCF